MKFDILTGNPALARTDCIVIGVHDSGELSAGARAIDRRCGGALSARPHSCLPFRA
jgi:hypothetical protein